MNALLLYNKCINKPKLLPNELIVQIKIYAFRKYDELFIIFFN
jgi:hypothetical protein